MTVNELTAKLQNMQSEGLGAYDVRFVYCYGDRGRTMVAQAVRRVEDASVRHSDYVNDMALVDADQDEKDGDQLVVVLR